MKRLLLLTVAFLLLLTCVSCGEDEDALVRVTHRRNGGEWDTVKLSQVQQSELLALLAAIDECQWIEDANNCGNDYKFETQTRHWEYHSECGSMSDYTNDCRCIKLTQEQADTLHDLLGIPRITVRDRS